IPDSILRRTKDPLMLLKNGFLESTLLGEGHWVEEIPGEWIYTNKPLDRKTVFLQRLFPLHEPRIDESSARKIPENQKWEDSNFFGKRDESIIRSNFDPEGKEPPQLIANFKIGRRNFDAVHFVDYDRQFGPGIWLELPDDYLGVYVFFP